MSGRQRIRIHRLLSAVAPLLSPYPRDRNALNKVALSGEEDGGHRSIINVDTFSTFELAGTAGSWWSVDAAAVSGPLSVVASLRGLPCLQNRQLDFITPRFFGC